MIDRRTGNRLGEEFLRSNCALVKYVPDGVPLQALTRREGEAVDDPRHWLNQLGGEPPDPQQR